MTDLNADEREELEDLREWNAEYFRLRAASERGSNVLLREALGIETWNRLWGPELEQLGRAVDVVMTRDVRLEQALESIIELGAPDMHGVYEPAEKRAWDMEQYARWALDTRHVLRAWPGDNRQHERQEAISQAAEASYDAGVRDGLNKSERDFEKLRAVAKAAANYREGISQEERRLYLHEMCAALDALDATEAGQ